MTLRACAPFISNVKKQKASKAFLNLVYFCLYLKIFVNMRLMTLLIFIILRSSSESTNEFCSINDKDTCGDINVSENHLTATDEKYKEFYRAIETAERNYVPCDMPKCGCYANVIDRDFKTFEKNGIDRRLIDAARSRGTLYQVIKGKLYREKECMFPSRCAGVEHFILKALSNISDIEFVINTRDYPQSSVHFGEPLPIFSFSKTADYYDIFYPAWSFWEGGPAISLYPRGLGRWDKHRESLNKASDDNPWNNKVKKAFFRGSRTSSERDNLVLLSRRRGDLVDAQYTKNQAWKSDEDTLHAPPASEVSLEDHCKYKYLFNYRGVAASFRHKHLFLCRSLVFHVGDEWLEFYYESMKPWIHYIPVSKDSTQNQLENLINFARDNDELSKKIAIRGRDFIWEKLRMRDIQCYWKQLLMKYSKLLKYKPDLRPELISISKIG